MADVFAELIAKAKIDMTAFNKQISQMKAKLASIGKASTASISGSSEAAAKAGKYYAKAGSDYEKYLKQIEESNSSAKNSIDKATSAVERFGRKGKKATDEVKVGFGGVVGMAMKAVATMGTVELGLGTVNVLTKAFSGNIEDAAEAIKRLPAGIGPVATQLEELLGWITGIKAETEAWERATANLNKVYANNVNIAVAQSMQDLDFKARKVVISDLISLEAKRQIAVITGNKIDEENYRKRLQESKNINRTLSIGVEYRKKEAELKKIQADADNESSDRLKKIADLREKIQKIDDKRFVKVRDPFTGDVMLTPSGYSEKEIREMKRPFTSELKSLEKLEEQRKKKIELIKEEKENLRKLGEEVEKLNELEKKGLEKDLEREKQDEKKKEREERSSKIMQELMSGADAADAAIKKLDEERKKREEERLKKERQAEEDWIKRVANLKAQINQKQLRLEGKTVEAEIAAVKAKFEEELKKAEGDIEKGLLTKQLALDIAAIRKADEESKAGPERVGLRQRFEDTLAKLSLSDRDAKIQRDRERAERRDNKRNEILQKIKDISAENKDILKNIDFDPRFQ